MNLRNLKRKLPGYVARSLLVLLTTLWTVWGFGEMYHEGWWGTWYNRLAYLVLPTAFLVLTAIALTRPRAGGWVLVVAGGGTFLWWMNMGGFAPQRLFMGFMLGGFAVLIGSLLIVDARLQQRLQTAPRARPASFLRRNLRYIVCFAPPLLAIVLMTALSAPLLLTRVDDGDRGMRLIEGNGVTLIWAPAGPGWSPGHGASQAAGMPPSEANPSWNDLALYGMPPVGLGDKPGYENSDATAADMSSTGLCRYLSEDGLTLMSEPQDIWRMPTTDEIVRSLVRYGENAGCTWDGESASAECRVMPNKDTPLWAPDWSPIYYWSADEHDAERAWYVAFNGNAVSHQPKNWGNPRHGYRCVCEP